MLNSILVYYDGEPYISLLIPNPNYKSISQILDIYAKWVGFDRKKLTGRFIITIDITDSETGFASRPTAKNDWKEIGE